LLGRLVAFDTTSRNSNLELIDFVAAFLARHGIPSRLIRDETGAKANLVATIGPEGPGGIVLSGHTDVVPVDGQPWTSDPWTMVERDGRLYGRGTADMKAFSAVALAMVPAFVAAKPKIPIHLALSYDEEIGCFGVPGIIDFMKKAGIRPRAIVVGEPTSMRVVNAHKGIQAFRTTVTGKEAHSSATHIGVSAIAVAAELIAELNRIADDLRRAADPKSRFDPPYTTIQIGVIQGGTAANIIPRECAFKWEYREIPGEDVAKIMSRFEARAAQLRAEMQRRAPEADILTELGPRLVPLVPEPGSPAETLALALARQNATHAVSYGTEAGAFQADLETPVVVCGPGDILQAHAPDEFIAVDQIEECVAFMRRLLAHVAS